MEDKIDMSDIKKSDGLKQFLKTLGDISSFAITVLSYIFAVLGLPIPLFPEYPATTSIAIIFFSIVFLWLWRWSKITDRNIFKPTKTKKKDSNNPSQKVSLLDPLRVSQSHLFVMPLIQRRLEIIFLLSLTLVAASITGVRFASAMEEISGLNCINKTADIPRVVIANFVVSSRSQFGDSLANVMGIQANNRFQVCRYNREIILLDEANDIGHKHQATLVIWGTINNDLAEVYITSISWTRRIGDSATTVKDRPEQIAVLADAVLAEMLLKQQNVDIAQENLNTALDTTQSFDQTDSILLSQVHLLYGLSLLDMGEYSEAIAVFENALNNSGANSDDPFYPYLLYYLGHAHLLSGDIPTAMQTYQALPALSAEDKDNMLEGLLDLLDYSNSPSARQAILETIQLIQSRPSN